MPPTESVLVSFLFGGGLLLAALLFARQTSHLGWGRRVAIRQQPASRHATRRQSTIVGLLMSLGGLIPLGDLWLTWHRDPRWFAVYVLVILGLSLWLLGLGVGEALSVLTSASHGDRSGSSDKPSG
jgi:hypothetical protein